MADVSRITLPNGQAYDLKDAAARLDIENLKKFQASGVTYQGTTTTALSDGLTTATYDVVENDKTVTKTANTGDMVSYNNIMFAWNGTQWDQLGSAGALKALAYKDSVSGSYKPAGSVSAPTFTGDALTSTGTVTPTGKVSTPTFKGSAGSVSATGTTAGSVSAPAFTGSKASISVSGTPKGTVGISTAAPATNQTATYTPTGSVSVTPNTTSIQQITGVGTLPSWNASVADENLTISWGAGTLPTRAAATVATGVKSAGFTGTGVMLNASFTGQTTTSTGDYTPAGTVAAPTFTGKDITVTGTFTPAGTVSTPTFTGDEANVSVSGTPSGKVSAPTFTGTQATITSK